MEEILNDEIVADLEEEIEEIELQNEMDEGNIEEINEGGEINVYNTNETANEE